jgi:hypothetical protein
VGGGTIASARGFASWHRTAEARERGGGELREGQLGFLTVTNGSNEMRMKCFPATGPSPLYLCLLREKTWGSIKLVYGGWRMVRLDLCKMCAVCYLQRKHRSRISSIWLVKATWLSTTEFTRLF